MIHINLNMIFYTHVEHSPTKTIYINYYLKKNNKKKKKTHYKHTHTHTYTHTHTHTRTHTHTHARTHARTHACTHNDCSRNWVLILGWKYWEKRKVFSLALKDDRVEQCLAVFLITVILSTGRVRGGLHATLCSYLIQIASP